LRFVLLLLAFINYNLLNIILYNISPTAINITNIKILLITIKTIYTNLINLNSVLLANVKYILDNYKGKFDINKLCYKATLSLIKLSFILKSIKYLALPSLIYISTFKYYFYN